MSSATEPRTETDASIDAGILSATPSPLDPAKARFFTVVTPGSDEVTIIDLEEQEDRYRRTPLRKTGTRTVTNAESFVDYLARHGSSSTEIYADLKGRRIVGVVDSHAGGPGEAGHQAHRIVLEVRQSLAWQKWAAINGKLLDQVTFAEHVEQRTSDIVKPDGATMLEIAQTLVGQRNVDFTAGSRLSSGQINLTWSETLDAKAGQKGDIVIPESLTLALAPFEGTDPYRVEASFRWRVQGGNLSLGVVLLDPETIVEEAFGDIVTAIRTGVPDHPLYLGTP